MVTPEDLTRAAEMEDLEAELLAAVQELAEVRAGAKKDRRLEAVLLRHRDHLLATMRDLGHWQDQELARLCGFKSSYGSRITQILGRKK